MPDRFARLVIMNTGLPTSGKPLGPGFMAWRAFAERSQDMDIGRVLQGALELSLGGANLRRLGYDEDIRAAARVDVFHLVPELRRDPLRVEVGSMGIGKSHWHKK